MPDPIKPRPARGAAQRVRNGNRMLIACIGCKERKLRCDDQAPACANCRRHGLECLVEDPATKRHQPRNYLETLEQRVIYLEGMLRELRPSLPGESVPGSSALGRSGSGIVNTDDADSRAGDLASMIGTLDLNAAGAEPCYLGSSSTFAFARFVEPSLRQVLSSMPQGVSPDDPNDYLSPEPCPLPDYRTAVRLSNAYFRNIQPQYPFLHEPTFRAWERALMDPFRALDILGYKSAPLYFLNMVYAVGALLLTNTGQSPERLYVSALLYLDDILCHDNLECIQAILCAAAYSLRSSKGTSHWKLAGNALRQCVNLGYHRDVERLRLGLNPLQLEMQKRVFWSAYVMECAAAVMLGRPLSLRHTEIDAKFPLDIEEGCVTEGGIQGSPRMSPEEPPNMMTYAIHSFRIRSLFGRVQTILYSDVTLTSPDVRKARVQELLAEADRWQAESPPPYVAPEGGALSFFCTPDWMQVNYNYLFMQLYRLQLTDNKDPPPDETVLKNMYAAKSTCHGYRRGFLGKPTAYTWGALHGMFLAGLTYLYCLWTSPAAREASRPDQVSSTCTDCTMFLVVFAEKWSDAGVYRDVFEALASRTMTMLTDKQQGKDPTSWTSVSMEQEPYPEELPQWMAGIADSGVSLGFDLLLSGMFEEFPSQEPFESVERPWQHTDASDL